MPRVVDRVERERAIKEAALALMAEGGMSAVTVRAIADRMGGSITLVTHFYPTREDLMRGIFHRILVDEVEALDRRSSGADARDRLRILVEWLIPSTVNGIRTEQARVLLTGDRKDTYPQQFLDLMESRMTQLLRSHLEPLVTPTEVEPLVVLLRTFTNGIVLSTIEHPDVWPTAKRFAVLHDFLRRLDLA